MTFEKNINSIEQEIFNYFLDEGIVTSQLTNETEAAIVTQKECDDYQAKIRCLMSEIKIKTSIHRALKEKLKEKFNRNNCK